MLKVSQVYAGLVLRLCEARLGVGAKVKDLTQYCTRDPDVEARDPLHDQTVKDVAIGALCLMFGFGPASGLS